MGGVAIHATLMHTDEVLFFQYVEGKAGADRTSYVATWNWKTGLLREAPFSAPRDVFCAGHNVLADGRVFIAGGHDPNTGKKQDAVGVVECDIFDPVARTWTRTAPMGQKRWYPTNVGLPNGKVLVFGGTASPGVQSATVDEYTPATNTMRRLPSTADKSLGLYPRMHLLANGRLLMSGPPKTSVYFDPATNRWTNGPAMIYGKRSHGVVALLPGSAKLMTAGGGSPTRTAEILDTSAASPRWVSTGQLTYARMLSNTVVLPDGQVLIIGGGAAFKYTRPVKIPELYNPTTGTWTAMAAHQASRMYHATALLLPDGRVLCAGQDNGSLARYGEIFSPPYLFRGARPTISSSPATVALGGPAAVQQSRRGRADEGRADPARVQHPRDRQRPAVGAADLHGLGHHRDRPGPQQRQRRAARLLHAVRREQHWCSGRRSVGAADLSRSRLRYCGGRRC